MDRRWLLRLVLLIIVVSCGFSPSASAAPYVLLTAEAEPIPADSTTMYPSLFGGDQSVVVLPDGGQPYVAQYPDQVPPGQSPVPLQSPTPYSVMAPPVANQPYYVPGGVGQPYAPAYAPGYAPTTPGLAPYAPRSPYGDGSVCRYATAEFMFLRLDNARQGDLAFDLASSQTVLTTNDFDIDYEPGLKASFGYQFGNRWAIEGLYFGLQNWNETEATRGGFGNLVIPGALGLALDDGGAPGVLAIESTYSVRLHNAELNGWRKIDDTLFAVMLGFRYINFTESLDINTVDGNSDQSDYLIKTKNNYFGGQLGGQMATTWGNLELQLIGKAGIFDNVAEQKSQATSENGLLLRDTKASVNKLAFVGDVGLNGRVKLMEKLYFRGGYYVMWMNGLVRAPDQLDYTNAATSGTAIVSDGTAFLHGGTIGIETWW